MTNTNIVFSYYKPPITNTIPVESATLQSVVNMMRSNANVKDFTAKVRAGALDKSQVLPFATFSGTFSKRNNASLLQYSGCFCIDLDHIGADKVAELKALIAKDTVLNPALIFISPRGEGLKIVLRIDNAIPENHFAYFRAFDSYFKATYKLNIDQACKDVSRACFLCHDPDVYFNPTGSISSEVLLPEPARQSVPVLPLPVDQPEPARTTERAISAVSENPAITDRTEKISVLNRLVAGVEKKGIHYTNGSKHNFLMELFGALCRAGIPEKDALQLVWERFSKTEGCEPVLFSDYTDRARDMYKRNADQFGKFPFGVQAETESDMQLQQQPEQQAKTASNKPAPINLLDKVLITQAKLRERKASVITFASPILTQHGNPVFFPNTINTIQGQTGCHKSRVTEVVCSAIIKRFPCENELLGFERAQLYPEYTVLIVDTERNLTEQLPFALQSIQTKAGYTREDHPEKFDYISLVEIDRKNRFPALRAYIDKIRQQTDSPLFIVLDVATDCIKDFNKVDDSMELIDLMNQAINEFNCIFLCIVHENPGTAKARGHFGTEMLNKSSTVIQVNFEQDGNGESTEIVRAKYLKCRSTQKNKPFHFRYCNDAKTLILAENSEVSELFNKRKHKVPSEDMCDMINLCLSDGTIISRTDLLEKLCKDFGAKFSTIEKRLKEIIAAETDFYNDNGQLCRLVKELKDKNIFYKLKPDESV